MSLEDVEKFDRVEDFSSGPQDELKLTTTNDTDEPSIIYHNNNDKQENLLDDNSQLQIIIPIKTKKRKLQTTKTKPKKKRKLGPKIINVIIQGDQTLNVDDLSEYIKCTLTGYREVKDKEFSVNILT